jgi:hypothetical protein
MAAWRRKAFELFPELRDDIESDAFSPYALFFMLLPFTRQAHRRGDDDALRRAYGFAQWCHHQRRGSELPNAVAVAFFEHLFDDWSVREDVVPWLSPVVRRDVWTLWDARLSEPQLSELRQLFDGDTVRHWQRLRDVQRGV